MKSFISLQWHLDNLNAEQLASCQSYLTAMPLDNHAWMFMPPTAILSVLTFTAYFAYRIYCLVIAQQTIQPANALGLAWFFLAIEFLIFGTYLYLLHEVKRDRT
jgi:hypothetical protein